MTTILIVDDELDMRNLIEMMLLKSNFRVLTAENGQQAYDILNNEKIDLDFCWVPLEDLKNGTKVYPLELIPHIIEPKQQIVHFISK